MLLQRRGVFGKGGLGRGGEASAGGRTGKLLVGDNVVCNMIP